MDRDITTLINDINKQFTPDGSAKPVISGGSEFLPTNFIPCCSPALGFALTTGGWFEGKLHEFFGQEHAGKTSLMFLALKDCLEYYKGDRIVALIDVEHRFNPEWAETLGLKKDENLIVAQPPDAESATDIMIRLIKSKKVGAIGFDSIAAAQGESTHQLFSEQKTMFGGNAAIMTRNVHTVAPLANLFNCTIFYLNQLRDDMAGYNRPMTPGGRAVKHMMSLRLYLRPAKEKYFDKTPEGEIQVGFPIVFKILKNNFGPAFKETFSDFYNQPSVWLDHVGFDYNKDLQRLGLLTGIIKQGGPWYSWRDIKEQGRDKFFLKLDEKGLLGELEDEVRQAYLTAVPSSPDELPEAEGPELNDSNV